MGINITRIPVSLSHLTAISIAGIITTIIQILLGVAGIAAFISLLIGGLQWIMSGGEKEGIERARRRLISALVGLAIVFSSYAIFHLVGTIWGINIDTFTLPVITG